MVVLGRPACIGRPVRATITLYSIGRPVRATITLYPIGRPVRTTITLYPIGRPVRATITLYPIGRPVRAITKSCHYRDSIQGNMILTDKIIDPQAKSTYDLTNAIHPTARQPQLMTI